MARLPTPGGDNGDWGTILNDFLSRIHSNDGTLKPNSVGSTQIQDNAVTSSAIAPAAITTDAIAPNAVTVEALAPNTIDDTVIADGSITNALIADATIEETKLASAVQAKLNATAPVTSVATRTGDVTLDKADVGLGNVDNTSDATKNSAVATLVNKRVTKRVGTIASSSNPTINTDNYDVFKITALATGVASFTTNLTGTPTDEQQLVIVIKDNNTARALTWGASFQSSGVASLPTTTVIGKIHRVGLVYDTQVSRWVCIAADASGY